MCGGNRTGSLGNSAAAAHPVVLVNFLRVVSCFVNFPILYLFALSITSFFGHGNWQRTIWSHRGSAHGVDDVHATKHPGRNGSMKRDLSTEHEAANENLSFGHSQGAQFVPLSTYHPMIPAQYSALKYPAGTGVSLANTGTCFKCGMVGHFRKYCPRVLSGKGTGAMNK